MSNIQLQNESKKILKQFSISNYSHALICPILKVLQMRHNDLDIQQATQVIRGILKN